MFKLNLPSGVTLIELMITLAVVAIIAVFAIPRFGANITKSRITSGMQTLATLQNAARQQFEDNSSATSLSFGGNTLNSNTVTALNIPPVVNALYVPPGGVGYVGANSYMVCVYIGNLSIDGFVAPTPGSAGTHSRVCQLVTAGNAIYTSLCGALDGSATDIPVSYLPTNCKCASVSTGTC